MALDTKWLEYHGPQPMEGSPVPGTHIWGWMSPKQLLWLGEQAAEMSSIAEIGSLRGRSAFALLTACKGPVYCVDPFNAAYEPFMENVGHFPNLRVIKAESPAAAAQVPDVDMTFIDGCHDYEAVRADIDAWLPKTRKLICGHDYESVPYHGVTSAVRETFGDTQSIDGIWFEWL